MPTITFKTELPSGMALVVEADVTPIIMGRIDCAPEDAYPTEGGEVDLIETNIKTEDGQLIPVDLSDLWLVIRDKPVLLDNWLEDEAYSAFEQGEYEG